MLRLIHVAQAQGPIDTAPRLADILTNILNVLLSVVGVVGIIGLVIAGVLYFFAAGNERSAQLAKRAFLASVTGIVIALAGLIIVRTLASFVE